jgi:RND family efflux transporter MFP subunit
MRSRSGSTFWHWGAVALVVLIAAALVAFFMMPRYVEVIRPAYGPAVLAVYATGTVEASVMMPVAPRIGARLKELEVDEGAEVHKGQVLARLEDTDLLSSLRQLESQEKFARKDYQRYAAMLKEGVIARQLYDRAKMDWQASVAAVARARAEVGFTVLVAADNGRVIRRDGEIGQLIPANQPVFWLSHRAPLRISADVDEEDIARVAPGQDVLIRADAFRGRIFHGRVQSITPKGDPIARSYRVRVQFDQSAPLMIGMTAEINIVIEKKTRALLVPASAVIANRVWLVRDGKLESLPVSAGIRSTNEIEITSGLVPTQTVVLAPESTFRQGAPARAVVTPFIP